MSEIKKLLDEAFVEKLKRQKQIEQKWFVLKQECSHEEKIELNKLDEYLNPLDTKLMVLDLCDKYKEIILELVEALEKIKNARRDNPNQEMGDLLLFKSEVSIQALEKVEARLRRMK